MLAIILAVCLFKIHNAYTADEITKLVDWHNEVREFTGKGETLCANKQYCPASSSLAASKLQWSVGLAKVAENYNVCTGSRGVLPDHNANRKTEFLAHCRSNPSDCPTGWESLSVGENLSWGWQNSEQNIDEAIGNVDYGWYKDEALKMPISYVDSFKFVSGIGHFTQIIWENTKYVGCAYHKCADTYFGKYKYQHTLLCNYATAGNYGGQTIYKKGTSTGPIPSVAPTKKPTARPTTEGSTPSEPDCFKITFTGDYSWLNTKYGGSYVATQQSGYTSYNGYPVYTNGNLWLYRYNSHWLIHSGVPVSTDSASYIFACWDTADVAKCDWQYRGQVIGDTEQSCSRTTAGVTIPRLPFRSASASARKLNLELKELKTLNKMIKQIQQL